VANAGTLNDTAPGANSRRDSFRIRSISGLTVELNVGHYAASRHGVDGPMRTLSGELAPYGIRVNSINPTNVDTPMINNPANNQLLAGGKTGATQDNALVAWTAMHALPVRSWIHQTVTANGNERLDSPNPPNVLSTNASHKTPPPLRGDGALTIAASDERLLLGRSVVRSVHRSRSAVPVRGVLQAVASAQVDVEPLPPRATSSSSTHGAPEHVIAAFRSPLPERLRTSIPTLRV
jgi:hypothetical protein